MEKEEFTKSDLKNLEKNQKLEEEFNWECRNCKKEGITVSRFENLICSCPKCGNKKNFLLWREKYNCSQCKKRWFYFKNPKKLGIKEMSEEVGVEVDIFFKYLGSIWCLTCANN